MQPLPVQLQGLLHHLRSLAASESYPFELSVIPIEEPHRHEFHSVLAEIALYVLLRCVEVQAPDENLLLLLYVRRNELLRPRSLGVGTSFVLNLWKFCRLLDGEILELIRFVQLSHPSVKLFFYAFCNVERHS